MWADDLFKSHSVGLHSVEKSVILTLLARRRNAKRRETLMEATPKTTKEIILEVLGKPCYQSEQFDFKNDARFIRHLVAVLEDPTEAVIEEEGNASPAAGWLSSSLLFELGREAANSVTCDLFSTLGRQNELGWMEKQDS
jgi:hypothetical protein